MCIGVDEDVGGDDRWVTRDVTGWTRGRRRGVDGASMCIIFISLFRFIVIQ